VISVGADNPYGHPAQEALDRLASVGAEIYRTDIHGTVVIETGGTTYIISTEK
jgi:competence protein ComEC